MRTLTHIIRNDEGARGVGGSPRRDERNSRYVASYCQDDMAPTSAGDANAGAGAARGSVWGWFADGSHSDSHTDTSSLRDVAYRVQPEPDTIRFEYPECGERGVAISRLGSRREHH